MRFLKLSGVGDASALDGKAIVRAVQHILQTFLDYEPGKALETATATRQILDFALVFAAKRLQTIEIKAKSDMELLTPEIAKLPSVDNGRRIGEYLQRRKTLSLRSRRLASSLRLKLQKLVVAILKLP